jgi:branched-chain amino acid transport system substrate-binding protein
VTIRTHVVVALASVSLFVATACSPTAAPAQPTAAPPTAAPAKPAAAPTTAAPASQAQPTSAPAPAAASTSNAPIKIGEIGEYTGPLSATNTFYYNALEWVFQQYGNNTLAGRPVQFFRIEDQAKTDVFQSEVRRAIEVEKAPLLVGPINSSLGTSAGDWINQQPVVFTTPEIGAVQYYPGENMTRWTTTSWHLALPDLGKFYAEKGIKKAVTIGLDYAAGRDHVQGEVDKVFPAGNIQVVQQFWVPLGAADYGPIFAQIETGPDVLVTGALYGADGDKFQQQASEFGIKDRVGMISFPAAFALDDQGLDKLGPVADGMYVYNDQPPPDYPDPEYQKFVADFKAKFNVPPSYGSKALFNYLQIKQAAEAVKGNVEDRPAFQKAMREPVKTPFDTVMFDACGNAVRKVFLKQVKNVNGVWQNTLVRELPGASIPCPQPANFKSS